MRTQCERPFSRRRFLGGLTLAGMAGLLGWHPRPVTAEPPPETTRLRLGRTPGICSAPYYVAEEFLPGAGFTEVQYVQLPQGPGGLSTRAVATGEIDVGVNFIGPTLPQLEAGDPLVLLSGAHVGCFELVGTDRVHAIRDLKGKTVAVSELGGPAHVFLASMAAYVGLEPSKDITWVIHPIAAAASMLAEGKIDAVMAFPPQTQELRAKQIGHVVVNSAVDRPWSQYFCCMVFAHREFVRKHPVATKRALRAILKATDLCAREPERAAQFIVDKEYVKRYDYAFQTMKDVPYNQWREYDPEDTVRFYALRLHEVGMIKSSPQKLIAQHTDWRFLNELKKELKG